MYKANQTRLLVRGLTPAPNLGRPVKTFIDFLLDLLFAGFDFLARLQRDEIPEQTPRVLFDDI